MIKRGLHANLGDLHEKRIYPCAAQGPTASAKHHQLLLPHGAPDASSFEIEQVWLHHGTTKSGLENTQTTEVTSKQNPETLYKAFCTR